jgi:disulfide bond formation protein DsbB
MQQKARFNWRAVPQRVWFIILALGCFGLVAAGMVLQDIYRLAPCPLCIFQRVLYLVVGTLALLGVLAPVAGRFLGGAVFVVALGGFVTAAYQTWMQAFPEQATECSYTDPNLIERLVDWLGMQWPDWFLATGFCTSREWELFGLSLANWSCVVFAGILGYAWLFFLRRSR